MSKPYNPEKERHRETLNKMGYMNLDPDWIQIQFFEFLPQAKGPGLDIGCAYGVVTLEALKRGYSMIAVDMEKGHLDVVQSEAKKNGWEKNLNCICARFPEGVDLSANSVGAVMLSKLIHFLKGRELEEGFKKIHHWLKPGGKVIMSSMTPFWKTQVDLLPEYQRRKAAGEKWPGEVKVPEKLHALFTGTLPLEMHMLEAEILERELRNIGFRIDLAQDQPLDVPDDRMGLDGREVAVVIASKI